MEKSAILLVGNGRLITREPQQPLVEDGCVAIRDGLIAETGHDRRAQAQLRRVPISSMHGAGSSCPA